MGPIQNIRYCKAACIALAAAIVWISAGFFGCTDPDSQTMNDYLVKIDGRTLTVVDYNAALEMAKTAYPHNTIQSPDVLKSIRLRLLNQLIEEMVISVKASELGIIISDKELDNAVASVKQDYPGDEFKQAFLENAISFEAWKERLKTRLLIEKVIKTELQEKISITPEDISTYYEKNQNRAVGESPSGTDLERIDESIIKQIRRKKAEDSYKNWMDNLKKEYAVDINKKIWNKIIES